MADGDVAPEERQMLERIGMALGVVASKPA